MLKVCLLFFKVGLPIIPPIILSLLFKLQVDKREKKCEGLRVISNELNDTLRVFETIKKFKQTYKQTHTSAESQLH